MSNRISPRMKQVLAHVVAGGKPSDLVHNMSESGGMHGTLGALARRGLLSWKYEPTAKGRQLVAALAANKPR